MEKFSTSKLYYLIAALLIAGLLIASGVMMRSETQQAEPVRAQVIDWVLQDSGTTEFLRSTYFVDSFNGWAVGINGTILKTTDGGTTWAPQTSGTTADIEDVHFTDVNTGWAVGINGTILKTTDGGTTWAPQTSGTTTNLYGVSFTAPDTLWVVGGAVGGAGVIRKTTDGGASWTEFATVKSIRSVHFYDATHGAGVGESGTIVYWNGTNWSPAISNTTVHLYDVHFADETTAWAIGDSGTNLKSIDGGANWTVQAPQKALYLRGLHFVDASNGWIVSGNPHGIFYTNNGGASWIQQAVDPNAGLLLYDIYGVSSNLAWAVGSDGTILRYGTPGPPPPPSCGDTITTSVTLTEDILSCEDGLTIGANNVTLDCNGHTLAGTGSGIGVSINGHQDVAVKNCVITDYEKVVDINSAANFKLLDSKIAASVAGLHVQGTNTGAVIAGNEFAIQGIEKAAGASLSASYCAGDSIDGIGNNFVDVESSEVYFGICDDLNGNGTYDKKDGGVFFSILERYGVGKWSSDTFQKSTWDDNFVAPTLATLDRNCDKLTALTSEYAESCASIETTLKVVHTNGINPVNLKPVGSWDVNHADVLRYKDAIVIPQDWIAIPQIVIPQIDIMASTFADGYSLGAVIYGAPSGTGVEALSELAGVTYTFTPPTGTTAYCDGVAVSGSANGCKVLELRNGGIDMWRMEFGAGTQASEFQMDDEETGVANAANNPICSNNYETVNPGYTCDAAGVTHYDADASHTNKQFETTDDAVAFVDVLDSGFTKDATAGVDVVDNVIYVSVEPPADMPTADDPAFGNKPPKMSLGMMVSLGPNSGTGPASYTVSGKDITTTGFGFTPFGQSSSPRAVPSNASFNSVHFNVFNHTADLNVRETIDETSTLVKQWAPGAGDSTSGAVAKGGGHLTFTNNTVVNAEDVTSTVSAAVKSALSTNSKLHGDYANGVAYANGNGTMYNVNIAGNNLKNVFGGIGVYGAKTKISGNTIRTSDNNLEYEARVDEKVREHYPDYPVDFPEPDGNPPSMRDDFAGTPAIQAIVVGCGYKNTTHDGRDGTYALGTPNDPYKGEQDTKGNFMDLWNEGSNHEDNCYPVIIEENTMIGNKGAAISVAGEWSGSPALCNEYGAEYSDICAEMPTVDVLVGGNVIEASGVAPEGVGYAHARDANGGLLPAPADGFATCMDFGAPGLEELKNVDLTLNTKETLNMGGVTKTVTANLPHYYAVDNTCGKREYDGNGNVVSEVGSGGVGVFGSMVSFLKENKIYSPPFIGMAGACDAREGYRRALSEYGEDVAGTLFDCGIWLDGNEIYNSGIQRYSVTQKYMGESTVGAGDGVITLDELKSVLDANIAFVYDNASQDVDGRAYVATRNTGSTDYDDAFKVALDVSGVVGDTQKITDYFDTISTTLQENKSSTGEAAKVVVTNDPNTTALQVAIEKVLDNVETGVLNARCGVRGQIQGACDATVKVYDGDCAATLPKNDPEYIMEQCPLLVQKSESDSTDARFAYYRIEQVPYDKELYVIAESHDLTDELGYAILSNHPNIRPVTEAYPETSANLIMTVKVDDTKQGMKTSKETGSELWIYEPTSVLWDGVTEYYPFVFESDSNWSIDVCLNPPEGYEVMDGEACIQTLVAGEIKTINFKLVEVGSVPGDTVVNWTFTKPNGQTVKQKTKVGIRLHHKLAQKKGVKVDNRGRKK